MAERAWAGAIQSAMPWLQMYLQDQMARERATESERRTEESMLSRWIGAQDLEYAPTPAVPGMPAIPEVPPVDIRPEVLPPALPGPEMAMTPAQFLQPGARPALPAPAVRPAPGLRLPAEAITAPGAPAFPAIPARPAVPARPVPLQEQLGMIKAREIPPGVQRRERGLTPWQQGWQGRQDMLKKMRESSKAAGVSDPLVKISGEIAKQISLAKLNTQEADRLETSAEATAEQVTSIPSLRAAAVAHRKTAQSRMSQYHALFNKEKDPGAKEYMATQMNALEPTWFGLGKPKVVTKYEVVPKDAGVKPKRDRAIETFKTKYPGVTPTEPQIQALMKQL